VSWTDGGRHDGGQRSRGGEVNRLVSARADEVLRLAAAADIGGVLVRDLVRLQVRPGRSPAVTRASLSRTLRRLWRAGLVELHDRLDSLSTKRQMARERLQRFEADPVGSYQGYRSWAAQLRRADAYGSAEAFLAAKRVQASAVPHLRVVRVTATPRGRELVGRLEGTSPDDGTAESGSMYRLEECP